jgi:hypothetical protein
LKFESFRIPWLRLVFGSEAVHRETALDLEIGD